MRCRSTTRRLRSTLYDVVLSDMAPRTTGNRLGDQTRSFELFMRALAVAEKLLKPGGAFVGKIFMGGGPHQGEGRGETAVH
jgi:23S rRNA U2552 (ribose-2'-O)-methylase RlmE/FtsJ